MKGFFKRSLTWRRRYIVWTNWEYWSAVWFYLPLFPRLLYLSIRNGHPCFFTAANPGIYTGGIGLESKFVTTQKIPIAYRPKSILVGTPRMELVQLREALEKAGIVYPLIAKPDLGFRGFLVKKIANEAELLAYLKQYTIPVILQEYLYGRKEFGVLYHRFPGRKNGRISSLTFKELLSATGDGKQSLRSLINANPRALLQLEVLEQNYAHDMETIPAAGEEFNLGIIGNHCRGARFVNGNEYIDEQMTALFDAIASEMEGFYYGRFDIKCDSIEALKRGEGVKVIEVNGVCSEPVHIYDPSKITYFQAVRELGRHWHILSNIARINHRNGVPYMSVQEMLKVLISSRRHFKKLLRQV